MFKTPADESSGWHAPPGEIRLYCASLPETGPQLAALRNTLDGDELRRARRYRRSEDRAHFIAGRGILRSILSRHLAITPGKVRFSTNPQGRPYLSDEPDLHFSLSRSAGSALYAVAWKRPVGVDLERIRPDLPIEGIAQLFFSPSEFAFFNETNEATRTAAFFEVWTCKEAFLKARGTGFAIPSGELPEVTSDAPKLDRPTTSGWLIRNIDVGPDYAAAVACEGMDAEVRVCRWAEKPSEQVPVSHVLRIHDRGQYSLAPLLWSTLHIPRWLRRH
jgi:4'-phosphopantetheinyl transferase